MIYALWMIKHSADSDRAMAKLSKEEQETWNTDMEEAHTSVGAKVIMFANSIWANEQYSYWGITAFPTLEARIERNVVHFVAQFRLNQRSLRRHFGMVHRRNNVSSRGVGYRCVRAK